VSPAAPSGIHFSTAVGNSSFSAVELAAGTAVTCAFINSSGSPLTAPELSVNNRESLPLLAQKSGWQLLCRVGGAPQLAHDLAVSD
jgi:hypothetical protein